MDITHIAQVAQDIQAVVVLLAGAGGTLGYRLYRQAALPPLARTLADQAVKALARTLATNDATFEDAATAAVLAHAPKALKDNPALVRGAVKAAVTDVEIGLGAFQQAAATPEPAQPAQPQIDQEALRAALEKAIADGVDAALASVSQTAPAAQPVPSQTAPAPQPGQAEPAPTAPVTPPVQADPVPSTTVAQ